MNCAVHGFSSWSDRFSKSWQVTSALAIHCWVWLMCAQGSLTAAEPAATRPKPTAHETRTVHGWTVRVDQRLIEGEKAEAGQAALAVLERRLADLPMVLPADRLQRLQRVVIQIDLTHGSLVPAQYHPSAAWLTEHGFDAQLAKCVHIPDALEYASAAHQRVQPWSILHELAHAYHDQVLDFEHPGIKKAWQAFVDSGKYRRVLHVDGHETAHYALTNQMEFFAEMSESFLGTNDFFPFNRGELKREEPEIYHLLEQLWLGKPAE